MYIISVGPEISSGSNILDETYYYVSDTETTDKYNAASSLYLDGKNNIIVINLKTQRVISGSIIVPEGMVVDEFEDEVEISLVTKDYKCTTQTISLIGQETPFAFGIEEDYEGSIELSYTYCGDEPQLYKSKLYYTTKGADLNVADEDAIRLTEGDKMTDVKLELVENKATIDFVAKRSEMTDVSERIRTKFYIYTKTDEPNQIATISIKSNEYNTKATINIPDIIQYRDDDVFLQGTLT